MINYQSVIEEVSVILKKSTTPEELLGILQAISFTVGGMIVHFEQEDRSNILMHLVEKMGNGLIHTSKALDEECDISMITSEENGGIKQ